MVILMDRQRRGERKCLLETTGSGKANFLSYLAGTGEELKLAGLTPFLVEYYPRFFWKFLRGTQTFRVIFGVMLSKKNNSLVTPDQNYDS
jgi:hypothetical protein